jgi:hypothetical protein
MILTIPILFTIIYKVSHFLKGNHLSILLESNIQDLIVHDFIPQKQILYIKSKYFLVENFIFYFLISFQYFF